MTQAHDTTAAGTPEPRSQHARDVGLLGWLVDAVFLASELTDLCPHCLAEDVTIEVKNALDAMHQDSEEDEHGK